MVNLSKLSENLKELMNERGLNQTTLAQAMHTCSSKMSSYLTGKRAPNYPSFLAFLAFFHCSADFLLGLSEEPREEVPYNPVPPFGECLRKMLEKTQTSQYAFIKRSGISWGVCYHWLTGTSAPSMDNLVRIARFFDCSVDALLGRI